MGGGVSGEPKSLLDVLLLLIWASSICPKGPRSGLRPRGIRKQGMGLSVKAIDSFTFTFSFENLQLTTLRMRADVASRDHSLRLLDRDQGWTDSVPISDGNG